MDGELVSVVIPAHNASAFVAEAIGSVLTQSYEKLEVVVVDDGSSDGTAEIADSFEDERLRVIRQSNAGPSRARNNGLAMTSGDFVAFLDADDLWFPNKLERQLLSLRSDERISAIGCLMHYRSSSGRVLGVTGQTVEDSDQERIINARLLPFPLSATLFRRSTVDAVGGFDEVLRDAAEDLDLLARVGRHGRIACIDEVLGVYRIHPGSLSARKFFAQRSQARFVRARLESRDRGGDLSWHEFASQYRPSIRQRYDDLVHAWYRRAGLSVAERDWPRAVGYGLLAALFGPRYTFKRFRRQRLRPGE